MIAQCAASAEPANLAKYNVHTQRGRFNLFYHRHRIIAKKIAFKRAVLIVAANIARRRLTAALRERSGSRCPSECRTGIRQSALANDLKVAQRFITGPDSVKSEAEADGAQRSG